MASKRYLTKSRFKLAVECPTKLFYVRKEEKYEDSMSSNEFLMMLAEGGFQVGRLAQLCYPEGIEITEKNNQKAIDATAPYLKQENVVLFEPAIQFGPYLIRIDILVKKGNQYQLIEVKAKSYNSKEPNIRGARGGISKSMEPYLQDVAFQKWVLQQAIPNANIQTFLMMPDKAQTSPISGINQMFKVKQSNNEVETRIPSDIDIQPIANTLLYKLPVDEFTNEILSRPLKFGGGEMSFEEACEQWSKAYASDTKIPPVIGSYCGGCQFKSNQDISRSGFHECWKEANNWTDQDFENGTVLDLWNSRKKQKFIDNNLLKLTDLDKSDILKDDVDEEAGLNGLSRSQRQVLQLGEIPADYDFGDFYFDKPLVQVVMSDWNYPYHLIDFETSAVALPFYEGMRPYESIAFQFSHHILHQDGSVEHANEFLCVEPGEFPNYKFARALKKALSQDSGSVFMWSHHENTILSSILLQLSEDPQPPEDAEQLKEFILSITKGGDREMIDLCRIAEKAYFHPDTKGSNSIKKVLPAILKTSKFLQEIYSHPVYGSANGIKSKNFESFTWAQKDKTDLYGVLKEYAEKVLKETESLPDEDNTSIISEGGAAATAYSRLQFEYLDDANRENIKAALLRYCELDTLAMVMIVQGWQELIRIGNE